MEKDKEQYFWNFVFAMFFLALLYFATSLIFEKFGGLPTSIKPFDFLIISLATYRTIRLFTYDKITKFIREPLSQFGNGPLKTISDLLGCPWCFGIWSGFSIVFFYYYFYQFFWWIALALAVSALGSFFQILSNMVGWRAEGLKLEAGWRSGSDNSPSGCN